MGFLCFKKQMEIYVKEEKKKTKHAVCLGQLLLSTIKSFTTAF